MRKMSLLDEEEKDVWMKLEEEKKRAEQRAKCQDETCLETKCFKIGDLRNKDLRIKIILAGYEYSLSVCPFPCNEEKQKECKGKIFYGTWCDIAKKYLNSDDLSKKIEDMNVYVTRIVSNKPELFL